jgi:hypothetical protein
MPTLDLRNPGMPDLQFALFMVALCTSGLKDLNIPGPVRDLLFERCWALVNDGPPPAATAERVLDLRHGTEMTLEAVVEVIRSTLAEAGITRVTWDHPVSEATLPSSPDASPLVDRLNQWDPNPARLSRPPEEEPDRKSGPTS